MAISTTSPINVSPPVTSAPATPTSGAQPTGTDSPFLTALAAAGQAQQTQQANATAATDAATAAATANARDILANDKADLEKKDDAKDATLASLLSLAAQLLIPPANVAVAQAAGLTAPTTALTTAASGTNTAAVAVPVDATAARTRADQLRLDTAGGSLAVATGTTATQATSAATAALAQLTADTATAISAQTSTNTTTTTVPVPALSPNETAAQTAAATALRGQTSSILPQPPIITTGIPIPPVPADPSVTIPPVAEPTAPLPATALPSAQLGDRPTTAGERFAAIAFAGAQLAVPTPNTLDSVAFPDALRQTALEGRPLDAVSSTPVEPSTGTLNGTSLGVAPPPSLPASGPLPMAPTATPPTPAAQVAEAVIVHSQVLERNGTVEFRMHLDPPDLGRVQIRLITRGDEVHGQVLVANDAVRQMMESQMPDLRQRLEAAGVNIQRMDVTTDSGTGGNQNAHRDFTGQTFAPRTTALAPVVPPPRRASWFETGSLDVTV